METLFRFESGEFALELQGSEAFVREQMKPFLPLLAGGTTAAPEEDPDSLAAWYRTAIPRGQNPSMQDHILIFGYFLNRKKKQFIFVPDDMKCAFSDVERAVPKSLLQIMGSLKRDRNLLYSGSKRGEYCLTPEGLKYVEGILGVKRPEEKPVNHRERTVETETAAEIPAPEGSSSRAKLDSIFRAGTAAGSAGGDR